MCKKAETNVEEKLNSNYVDRVFVNAKRRKYNTNMQITQHKDTNCRLNIMW